MKLKDTNGELRYRRIVNCDVIGENNFTFDGEKIYNMWEDYPHNLTEEEIKLFDEAEPYWADFFKGRKQNNEAVDISQTNNENI